MRGRIHTHSNLAFTQVLCRTQLYETNVFENFVANVRDAFETIINFADKSQAAKTLEKKKKNNNKNKTHTHTHTHARFDMILYN